MQRPSPVARVRIPPSRGVRNARVGGSTPLLRHLCPCTARASDGTVRCEARQWQGFNPYLKAMTDTLYTLRGRLDDGLSWEQIGYPCPEPYLQGVARPLNPTPPAVCLSANTRRRQNRVVLDNCHYGSRSPGASVGNSSYRFCLRNPEIAVELHSPFPRGKPGSKAGIKTAKSRLSEAMSMYISHNLRRIGIPIV